jgi:hypothetical protein
MIVLGGTIEVGVEELPDPVLLVGAAGPTSTVVRGVPWPPEPLNTGGG